MHKKTKQKKLDRWGSENGRKEKTIKVLKDEDLDTEMGLALLTNESIDMFEKPREFQR